ncbi:MAG TPA: efflux RND transporter periplasmic adaptor subunit [Pyrinomonadaceae bacterium]|nr:efflux RND transporter periplasmic adaptor subunit [Pyrinomonadaceae bacterium]
MSEENLNNIDDKRPKEAEENKDAQAAEADEIDTSSNKRIFIALGVFVVAALLIGAYFYFRSPALAAESETEKKEDVVVSVKVEKAEKGPIAKEVSAIGTVAPVEQSTVSASISAQITQMRLLKNEFVQKGEVLATLASKDLQAQRSEAQAALEEAKLNLETVQRVTIPQTAAQAEKELSDAKATVDNKRAVYERRKDLYAKGGLPLKELEASKLELTNAENAYRLAQKNAELNKTAANPNARAIAQSKIKQAQDHLNALDAQARLAEIHSPISGIVTDQFQFEGEFAASGAKLLTIADLGEVFVKAQFADSVVADLKVGDAVTVHPADAPPEEPGGEMSGKVTLISRSADPQNRTVEVWARFGNPRGLLKVNGSAQFVVSSEPAEDAVVIPLSAVTLDASNADEGTVMTVDEGSVAHETKVKIGIKQGDKVQILEGLEGGETVVTEGNYALPDGTRVEIAKDEEEEEEK